MWFSKKAYLKFLFRSFHLHGIHSPFVFQLQQACFSKKENLLPRLVHYLKIETILVVGSVEKKPLKIPKTVSTISAEAQELDALLKKGQAFDLVYFPSQTENLYHLFQKTLPMAHNDSVFVFEKIHCSKEMEEVWKKIIQTEKVRVSIDSFHFGFLFFRKEQTKEDFAIRQK